MGLAKGGILLNILRKIFSLVWALSFFPVNACYDEDQRVLPSSSSQPIANAGDVAAGSGTKQNNSQASEDTPIDDIDLTNVTYANDIAPILQDSCINCHSTNGNAAFLPLENANQLQLALGDDPDSSTNGFLLRLTNDDAPMPANSSNEFRSDLIKIFNGWQDNKFQL